MDRDDELADPNVGMPALTLDEFRREYRALHQALGIEMPDALT